MRGRRGCTDEVRWKVKNEREEWKKKKNPDSSRISNFRPTYRGRDEKYIGSSSLPQPSGPYNTTLCVCVFACVCVSERGKNVDGNASDFLFFIFILCFLYMPSGALRIDCRSSAGEVQHSIAHVTKTAHWRHPSGGEREANSCPPLPTQPPEKKESSTQKKRRSWLSVRDATCDITVVPIWQLPPALLLTIEGPSASRLQCRGKRWLVVVLEKMKRRIATDPFFHFPQFFSFRKMPTIVTNAKRFAHLIGWHTHTQELLGSSCRGIK
jgi:hypothetical protein